MNQQRTTRYIIRLVFLSFFFVGLSSGVYAKTWQVHASDSSGFQYEDSGANPVALAEQLCNAWGLWHAGASGIHHSGSYNPTITVGFGGPWVTGSKYRYGCHAVSEDGGISHSIPHFIAITHWDSIPLSSQGEDLGPSCPSGLNGKNPILTGNPINNATGNKYQSETDYQGAGRFPLRFTRSYNSEANYQPDTLVGSHWRHYYERTVLKLANTGAVTLRPSGQGFYWKKIGGEYTSETDPASTLEKTADGWLYTTPSQSVETYDDLGKLLSIVNREGLTQTLAYNDRGLLTAVADSFGQTLTFTYSSDWLLDSLTTPAGDIYRYTYDSLGNLEAVSYPDQTPGNIADNPSKQYHYEDTNFPNYLTGITDENGHRQATWDYDDQGRAISSEHANGTDSYGLSYNANGTTTVTNPLGKETTYHYAQIMGQYKVTQVEGHPSANCAGVNKAYSYDANGYLSSKTDWNGNTTTYTRNNKGQELSRTEAAGTPQSRMITTEWHTEYRLPTKITEPGKTITFTYDGNAQLLSREETAIN